MSRTSADDSDPYTPQDEYHLYQWLLAAAVRAKLLGAPGSGGPTGRGPSQVDVKARVEWQGEERGVRPTTFGGGSTGGLSRADMRAVLVAVAVARDATARARDTRPLVSYRDRTPRAQWRKLTDTRAGREALAQANVNPSRSTLRKWSGGAAPGRVYAAAIAQAYEARRTAEARAATSGAQAAVAAVAALFTEALAQAYDGADIRIRDIERLNLWD